MYITFNDQDIWAFPAVGEEDGSAEGLFQIPELLGVGECLYIAYDQYKVLFEKNYEWVAVDPLIQPYDAQLLHLEQGDWLRLNEYVAQNTPKTTKWQKIKRTKPKCIDFVKMVEALSVALKDSNITEFYLYK